jgi:FtsP/CotA-like multicopper oxidase with cupredoxin domain
VFVSTTCLPTRSFLFTGLLLQTNPEGITSDRLLFSVIVGMLTTSIVAFTFYLFIRELFWQLMAALREVDEEEAAEELEWELNSADTDSDVGSSEQTPPAADAADAGLTWDCGALGKRGTVARVWRVRFAALACLALVLGLGLGLGLSKPALHEAAADDGVTRFTLVIAREPLPGLLGGAAKLGITINGTSPGPTLRVPFGRTLEVTVVNNVFDDATTVHWHGMLQRDTPGMDGVVGVTQCPISNAPGDNTMVYTFTPDRPGTFWYHGHYSGQYPDGLYGALIIDDGGAAFAGAAAARGVDAAHDATDPAAEWIWMAADWYDVPAAELLPQYLSPASGGDEPMPDAIVVNGFPTGGALAHEARRGVRQLVRFINTAAFSMWKVSVDGMPLTLVELDGIAIEPMDVPFVVLNVAQRAAFILDWSRLHPDVALSPSLWFRVDAMPSMYPTYDPLDADDGLIGTAGEEPFSPFWRGVIRFAGESSAAATPAYGDAPPMLTLSMPADVNVQAARPWPRVPAPPATHFAYMELYFSRTISASTARTSTAPRTPWPPPRSCWRRRYTRTARWRRTPRAR